MARRHPSLPLQQAQDVPFAVAAGAEGLVQDGLPDTFDVFHNLPWSAMHEGVQGFGEYALVVVSPGGQLLIVEVKAGNVTAAEGALTKTYGAKGPSNAPGAHGHTTGLAWPAGAGRDRGLSA